MNSDLTFITNEENKNLSERFRVLIQDTRFLMCSLVISIQVDFMSCIKLWRKYKE